MLAFPKDDYAPYICYDKSGKVLLYPTVSPENTPSNLLDKGVSYLGHPCTPTKNATIEIAIVKELFTNLLDLINETGEHKDLEKPLGDALDKMPDYMINEDGAIKEWTEEGLTDNYLHRHVSHIYPVFPGEEVTKENNPELFKAFMKAVELRKLGGQSGWSLSHIASIYATMGQGDKVIECLDILLKGSTLSNLMTLHNDYRNMGVTLTWDNPPIQLDANMGAVNAVQMMMLDERGGFIRLLEALPERFNKIRFTGLAFTKGKISCKYDRISEKFNASVTVTKSGDFKILLPEFIKNFSVESKTAKIKTDRNIILVSAEKGDKITIVSK